MNNSENINTPFLQLPKHQQKAALEAIIFSSEEPLTLHAIYSVLVMGMEKPNLNNSIIPGSDSFYLENQLNLMDSFEGNENFPISELKSMIDEINVELLQTGRPFEIVNYGGGYQFATRIEYGELIQRLIKFKTKRRLSQASMETLAIIAYKQPITKQEIEQIRGVNSGEIVNSLVEKGLIEIKGRKDILGKPLMFGTNSEFLKVFGINDLSELPKLKEVTDPDMFYNSLEADTVINIDNIDFERNIEKFEEDLQEQGKSI